LGARALGGGLVRVEGAALQRRLARPRADPHDRERHAQRDREEGLPGPASARQARGARGHRRGHRVPARPRLRLGHGPDHRRRRRPLHPASPNPSPGEGV
ncbi:MAG: 3-oxoacyl-[acyl-carrier protein] reductase, partial [uncultured Rubrobacteraceae bacterium]